MTERLKQVKDIVAQLTTSCGEGGDLLECLEEYTRMVDGLISSVPDLSECELKEVAALHAQVISVAEEELKGLAQSKRELHVREKALYAYLDTFPKQLSLGTKRKG